MSDYSKALPNFRNLHIALIGDVMLDRYVHGKIERINPEQPSAHVVKVDKPKREDYCLGGAGNVANNLVSLGAHVTLYGSLGEDREGTIFQELAKERGINLLKFPMDGDGIETIVKLRAIAHGQQIVRLDFGEYERRRFTRRSQSLFLNSFMQSLSQYDGILLSDYDKGTFTKYVAQGIISAARREGKIVAVDPKPQNIRRFRGSTVIAPNLKEALETTRIKQGLKESDDDFYKRLGTKLKENTAAEMVVVTLSEKGAFSYDGGIEYFPTQAREVADVTGAGDTFIATLTLALLSGLDIHNAANLANHAAGLVVEKRGTATVSLEELATSSKREETYING